MAGGKNGGNLIHVGGGYFQKGQNIKPDQWLCPNQECQKCGNDPRGHWVFGNKQYCNKCNTQRPAPNKIHLYRDSKWARKADGVIDNGGGGAAKGGGKGGKGGGATAENKLQKELRLLQERDQQQSKKDADRETQKEITRLKKKLDGGDVEEAEIEDDTSVDTGSIEKLQKAEKNRDDELKYWQGRLKTSKEGGDAEEITFVQQRHDDAKVEYEKAQTAVWDSQDPHEQMSKKTGKADRVRKQVVAEEKSLAAIMQEQADAEAKADECQVKIDAKIEKIEELKKQVRRLVEESHTIGVLVVGAGHESVGEIVDKHTKDTLGIFDHPLLAGNEEVRAKRPDVLALTQSIATALQALADINGKVRVGLDEAKAAVGEATSKKEAELEELQKKSANASKAADVVIPAVRRRSPKTEGAGGGSSSGDADQKAKAELQAAFAKPSNERNGEELLLTGRAGKSRKTARAADDMELSNV